MGAPRSITCVTPDLCTLGKAIAGGFPLTALAGRDEIMDHFDPVASDSENFLQHIGTLSGNPVAAAAGLATLKVLRREGTYERLFEVGRQLKDTLQRLLDEAEIPAQVIGEAPLFDVFFTQGEISDYRSTLQADQALASQFNTLLRERGILKGRSKFYLSTAHDAADIEHTVQAFASAVDALKG